MNGYPGTNVLEQPRDYIYIDISYHQLYDDLRKVREDEKQPPFKEMKHIFMLAALIGYIEEKWVALEKNQKNIFLRTSLKEEDIFLLRAIALAKTDDPEVLANERELQNIAEGYANGGIPVIKEKIEDRPGRRIDNLVDLLLSWEPYNDLVSTIQ